MENRIQVKKLQKQFKIGPAKCPREAVSSVAVWPIETNFLATPDFYDVAKLGRIFDVIEIQAQCPKDFYNNKEVMKNAVEFCRKNGIDVTLHFPFMDIEGDHETGFKVYQMPLVIPTAKHTIPPGYSTGKYNVGFAIKEMDPQLVRDVIDFATEMNIKLATLHVSVPKSRFTRPEFERYYSLVGRLADYATAKNFSISVETGGATLGELDRIMNLPVSFTHDIVHAALDGLNPVDVCDVLGERISKLHLSESAPDKDMHQQLKEQGNYTDMTRAVLAEIYKMKLKARMENRTYCPWVVFESPVSPDLLKSEGADQTKDGNVRVVSYITEDIINRQKVLILTHGLPRSGKSTILKKIAASLNDSNLDVRVISTDIERPIEQHRATLEGRYVPTEERGEVYDEVLSKAESCYAEGADVVAIDGTFGAREFRRNFIDFAHKTGCNLYIIETECPDWDTVKERLDERSIEGIVLPISLDIYRKLVNEFQPLNPVEVDGTNTTIIHYNSHDGVLAVRAGKKPTSVIADSMTRILMEYTGTRINGENRV